VFVAYVFVRGGSKLFENKYEGLCLQSELKNMRYAFLT